GDEEAAERGEGKPSKRAPNEERASPVEEDPEAGDREHLLHETAGPEEHGRDVHRRGRNPDPSGRSDFVPEGGVEAPLAEKREIGEQRPEAPHRVERDVTTEGRYRDHAHRRRVVVESDLALEVKRLSKDGRAPSKEIGLQQFYERVARRAIEG